MVFSGVRVRVADFPAEDFKADVPAPTTQQLTEQFERFAEAATAFRRAMELQPDNSNYNNYLGEALVFTATRGPQPLTEAERYFRRALELEPGNALSRFYIATIQNERGDHPGRRRARRRHGLTRAPPVPPRRGGRSSDASPQPRQPWPRTGTS